jgi:hypothetical protein
LPLLATPRLQTIDKFHSGIVDSTASLQTAIDDIQRRVLDQMHQQQEAWQPTLDKLDVA